MHPYCHSDNYHVIYSVLNHIDPTYRGKNVIIPKTTYSIHESVFKPETEQRIVELILLLKNEIVDTNCIAQITSMKTSLRNCYRYVSTYSSDKRNQTIVSVTEIRDVNNKSKCMIDVEAILYCCQKTSILNTETWLRLFNIFSRLSDPLKYKPVREPMLSLIVNEDLDYSAESFISDVIDSIIINQSSSFIDAKEILSTYQDIVDTLKSINVTKRKIDKSKIISMNKSSSRPKLAMNSNGLREKSYVERSQNENDYFNDGSYGDNNYREAGRYISSPSYENMREDSMP
ncbi:hypothetical protein GCM10027577_40360 [Spirosoma fluminis]